VKRAVQSRKFPAPLAPSVQSRPLRYSRRPTADPGSWMNSSSTPGPACRLPGSSDRESRGREHRPPPYCWASWCCRTGRGTYRPADQDPGQPPRRTKSLNRAAARRFPEHTRSGHCRFVKRAWPCSSVPLMFIAPERSPSIESRHHKPSVENLLFATEERLLSPDSVRLLYHESGGKSSTIHAL
jgi:hypothetical protein